MKQSLTRLLFAVALLTSTASLALAQGASATTSLAGAVADKDGGVIPGATVAVKNNGTAGHADRRHERLRRVFVPHARRGHVHRDDLALRDSRPSSSATSGCSPARRRR